MLVYFPILIKWSLRVIPIHLELTLLILLYFSQLSCRAGDSRWKHHRFLLLSVDCVAIDLIWVVTPVPCMLLLNDLLVNILVLVSLELLV